MSLWDVAERDLADTLEDTAQGFGKTIRLQPPGDPAAAEDLSGQAIDVAQTQDPETGIMIAGRTASVVLRIRTILAHFDSIPVGVSDPNSEPWLVTVADSEGTDITYKVASSLRDRSLGTVTLELELWRSR